MAYPSSVSARGPVTNRKTKLPALTARDAPARNRLPPTTSNVNKAIRATTTAPAAPSVGGASSSASTFVVFPELPDQLLCAPDNSIWIYGQYALSFFASESAAQAKLEKKVSAMLREAERHYEVSRAYFYSLSPEEQRAEVLRSAQNSSCTSSTGYANTANYSSNANNINNSSGVATHPSRSTTTASAAATAGAAVVEDSVYRALREAWPTWENGTKTGTATTNGVDGSNNKNGNGNTVLSANTKNQEGTAADVGETTDKWKDQKSGSRRCGVEYITENAASTHANSTECFDAASYPPGLRVNLVLDIIASRKTLGTTPLRSRAYRVAETLYGRLMRPSCPPINPEKGVHEAAAAVTLRNRLNPLNGGRDTEDNTSDDCDDGNHYLSNGITKLDGARLQEDVDSLRDIAPHVRTFIIGISDTDITLVGRDVVCPYRHLPSPSSLQLRIRSALESVADVQQQHKRQQLLSSSNSASVFAGTPASLTNTPTTTANMLTSANEVSAAAVSAAEASFVLKSLVSRQVLHRHSLDALLPAPLTRVAPTLLSHLDQTRLILCVPPVQWSAEEEV